jgi:hypothetical protein
VSGRLRICCILAVNSSSTSSDFSEPLPVRQLALSVAILTAVLAAAFPLFAVYGYHRHGSWGLIAAIVAALVCWASCSLALACVAFLQRTQPVAGILGSMIFRMGVPLVLGIALQQNHEQLAAAGIFGTILLYYLLSLIVETLLSVRLIPSSLQISKAS